MPSHVRYKVYTGRIVIITKIGAIPVVIMIPPADTLHQCHLLALGISVLI